MKTTTDKNRNRQLVEMVNVNNETANIFELFVP